MKLQLCAYPNLHIVHFTNSDSSPQDFNKKTLFKGKRQFNSILFRRITRILKNSIKLQHCNSSSVSLRRQCWRTRYFLSFSWYLISSASSATNIFACDFFSARFEWDIIFIDTFEIIFEDTWNVEFLLVYWGRIVGGVHLEIR